MPEPKVGDKAPDFSLPASNGKTISLKGLAGKKVVLYFYPKDDTPGCTKEACGFRDANIELGKLGVQVLGVSAQNVASHQKFTQKYNLNFPLLADTEKTAANAYGAWGEKVFMGRKTIGMIRKTFLIDEKGKIAKVWPKVKAEGHAEEVLAAIKAE
ncbi:MAG: thioredoxin-dependent thiol peroxidase [SAR202 cluster bacterium]|nr:thioredoxin-dependent thiol peroxidase [SAR202 cluster bacterium]